jgi:hypothetical protein
MLSAANEYIDAKISTSPALATALSKLTALHSILSFGPFFRAFLSGRKNLPNQPDSDILF